MDRLPLYLTLFVILSATNGATQNINLEERFQWSAVIPQEEIRQGQSGTVEITYNIADDHYAYRERTFITLEENESVIAGEVEFAEPILKFDPFEEKDMEVYVGESFFRVPFTVRPDAPVGNTELSLEIRDHGCSQTMCFFPQSRVLTVQFTVVEGDPSAEPAATTGADDIGAMTPLTAAPTEGMVGEWLSRGLLITFLFAFGLGLLTCLTPCVYPLIPITITIFGARETKSAFHAFTLASTYVLGIAAMYSLLGFLAATTGALFGAFMVNPWVMGFIALVFILLGASMLGAFELQLPSHWQAKLTQVGGVGYGSAFLMGTAAGIIAAPCTGPILAGILAYVATQASPWFGVSLLFVYALGLGMPFLILGTFSTMINRLPRSGAWMESVKSVFGIILFTAALFFLKDAFPLLRAPLSNTSGMYIFSAILLIVGLALGAVHLSFHTSNAVHRVRKGVGLLLSVGALYLISGSMTIVQATEVDWIYDLEGGLAIAQEQGRPAMVDFTADWCVECRKIEATTFSDPEVGRQLSEYVAIKIDLTRPDEALTAEYGIIGLPWIVFYDSEGNRLTDKTITGYIGPEAFLDHITDIE